MKITKKDIGRAVATRARGNFIIDEVFSDAVYIKNSKCSVVVSRRGYFNTDERCEGEHDVVGFLNKKTNWKARALSAEKELAALKEKIKDLL